MKKFNFDIDKIEEDPESVFIRAEIKKFKELGLNTNIDDTIALQEEQQILEKLNKLEDKNKDKEYDITETNNAENDELVM